ncbi:MAG: SPOR domain-containing protein [Cypionkella sp.]
MNRSTRMLTLAAGTALASLTLAGCATKAAPRAELSASSAEAALKQGKVIAAIAHAEAAVLADPRNPAYRTTLGAAYMEAGRFLSARTSFDDALELGDESARTALGFALASIATGDTGAALQVLDEWQGDIPAADLGLALALAGDTARGVHVLTGAVRGGDNTPKARQNLAYALALNGNWAGARIMAAEDVPADQLDQRLAEWARMAQAEHGPTRVAALLGTKVAADGGQPAQLALAASPTIEQLAAQAEAPAAPADLPAGELPALAEAAPMPAAPAEPTREFQAAFAEPVAPMAPVETAGDSSNAVSQPVVQAVAARAPRPAPARAPRAAAASSATGNHLVQLGSFSSEAGARRAWSIYERQFPQLAGYEMVITKAVVRGKTFFRVSAGGLSRTAAAATCSSVRGKGQGCYAWTQGRPLPGAVDIGVRLARR